VSDDVLHRSMVDAVKLIAGRVGVELDAEQVVVLAQRASTMLVGLIDTAAKRKAEAAGDAAAAAITTEDAAEAAQRKP
jgi:hypothetical protein